MATGGSSILAGLESGADVSSLLGVSPGSNLGAYSTAGTGVKIASTGSQLATQLSKEGSWLHLFGKIGGVASEAIGAALMIVSRIFGGADPYNVPAAETEQAFEGAVQNFKALDFAGYITRAEASAAISAMLKAGQTYYNAIIQKLKSENASSYEIKPFQNGLAHMTAIISGDVQNPYKENWPDHTPKAWNESAAESLYIKAGQGTWYGPAAQAAANLTNGYMAQLRAQSATSSAVLSTAKGKLALAAIGTGLVAVLHSL